MAWLLFASAVLSLSMFGIYSAAGANKSAVDEEPAAIGTVQTEPTDAGEALQGDIAETGAQTGEADEPAETQTGDPVDRNSWELILVNRQNILPEDFTVDLVPFENTRVDCRIEQPLQDMIDAAKAAGINISVCSGFRTVAQQDKLYGSKCMAYLAQGFSDEECQALASQYLQKGGMSEHHTGLAVDLLTDGVTQLDENFAKSQAYTWLQENAAQYGFVERYPNGKEQLTGIYWEPWHYRYVGPENADAMVAGDLCLEEYLENANS